MPSPHAGPTAAAMEQEIRDLNRQLGQLEAENATLQQRLRDQNITIVHLVSLYNPVHESTRATTRLLDATEESLNKLEAQVMQRETELEQWKESAVASLNVAHDIHEEYKATTEGALAEINTQLAQIKKDSAATVAAAQAVVQNYQKTAAVELAAAHLEIEQLKKTAAEASKAKVTPRLDQIDETEEVDLIGLHSGAICQKLEPNTDKQGIIFSTQQNERRTLPNPPLFYRDSDGKKRQIPGTGDLPNIIPDNVHWSRRGNNVFTVPFHTQQRLLNAAVFTETLEGEELDNHWELFVKDNKRYSKEQWQAYYHEVIRPMYLAKQVAAKSFTSPGKSTATDTKDVENATTPPAKSPVTDKKDPIEITISSTTISVNDTENIGDSTTLQTSGEASFHTVSLIDSADLSPQDSATTPSSVKIHYGDKQIAFEYEDKSADQADSNITSTFLATPEASYAGPTLLGSVEQLAEARSFFSSATKSRGRDRNKARYSPDIKSSGEFGTASSMHAPEPSVLHNDNFGGNTAVEVAGLPADLLAHDVIICLKPRGMISGRFVKTAGMKTIPPITTNTFIAVFPTNYITHAFCANKEAKEARLAELVGTEVKLVFRQLPNDSQIIARRYQHLVDKGITCSLLVEITETDWASKDLLDMIRQNSNTAITTLSITDSFDKQSVLIIFSDILMAWKAHNILKDHAELESCFVGPWADADEDSSPEEMDEITETLPKQEEESA